MLDIIAEVLGTFFFVSVILFTGQPIPIAFALLTSIYFTSLVSKGSMNPAVSLILLMKGDLSMGSSVLYIIAEFAGAMIALLWYNYAKANTSP